MSVRRAAIVVFATLAGALGLPTAAVACRQLVTPTPFPAYPKIVVVKVVSGGFSGDQSRFFQWKARARPTATVAGSESRRTVSFAGAFESSGCGRFKTPAPAAGERWVLFYDESGAVRWSFPLNRARTLDPRVAALSD